MGRRDLNRQLKLLRLLDLCSNLGNRKFHLNLFYHIYVSRKSVSVNISGLEYFHRTEEINLVPTFRWTLFQNRKILGYKTIPINPVYLWIQNITDQHQMLNKPMCCCCIFLNGHFIEMDCYCRILFLNSWNSITVSVTSLTNTLCLN